MMKAKKKQNEAQNPEWGQQTQNEAMLQQQLHLPVSMSASSMKWVVRRMTRPARRFLRSDHRWRREYGSIPAVGSSIKTI